MSIFGFWSLKGGTARTTLVASIATMLAQEGTPVGVVDADLEGSGLDVFFPSTWQGAVLDGPALSTLSRELVDYYDKNLTGTLVDALRNGDQAVTGTYWFKVRDLADQLTIAGNGYPDGLYLMPCGRCWSKLASMRYTDQDVVRVRKLVEAMRRTLSLTHVFVDCRSGVADSALAAALSVDCVVMTLVPSHAHLLGTMDARRVIERAMPLQPEFTMAQDVHYVVAKVPVGEQTEEDKKAYGWHDAEGKLVDTETALGGFFDQDKFRTKGLTHSFSVVPFHRGMMYRERMPFLLRQQDRSEADEEYIKAVRELWRALVARTEKTVVAGRL